ncbi:hypothetical protein PFISCL1PPCAC_15464 [Pristionchus fissidentatus]|uniref:Mediator of RNA polymerase II transcription subunit 29 n=1 Tax=Pristionchus fissidentatus TaxID=1538716 RepID=A0AAV5VZJ3_9BILA|nr:hypothetical protein PFISCL1PPCAC_15464 [Pristionchus fissidentatus]
MSAFPNQPNQHHQAQPQQQHSMYHPQLDQTVIASQHTNQPNQMNFGLGGLGQTSDSFIHQHNQQYSMNSAPSGMNPQIYSSLAGPFPARSPYNIAAQGMSSIGGPHSIPQPGSSNPLSVPQQGPGSVPGHGPLSAPQHGPGSVQGSLSISHQGPGSVPGHGPLSLPHHGPGSIPINTPLSVPQPTSVLGAAGPGSVPQVVDPASIGGPLSVAGLSSTGGVLSSQGPSPSSLGIPPQVLHTNAIGQGRSPLLLGPSPSSAGVLHQGTSPSVNNPPSHGGPQSASGLNPSTSYDSPATRQPIQAVEESVPYEGIFFADPMQLSKKLISKDLRQSFSEMNKSMGELLRNRDNLTPEQNEKYTRDYNEFMAVCDQVEQSLTIVMETSKMMSKLDRSYTPDGGSQAGRSNEYSTQPLINYIEETSSMTANVEKTVAGVFDMMTRIRKREALNKGINGSREELKMETE